MVPTAATRSPGRFPTPVTILASCDSVRIPLCVRPT